MTPWDGPSIAKGFSPCAPWRAHACYCCPHAASLAFLAFVKVSLHGLLTITQIRSDKPHKYAPIKAVKGPATVEVYRQSIRKTATGVHTRVSTRGVGSNVSGSCGTEATFIAKDRV